MSEYGKADTPTSVRIERRLPGPIERVWSYIVDGEETEVIFELTPAGSDVILAITQTKLAEAGKKAAYGSGWHTYLDTLEDRLRNVEPRGFWTNFEKRQAEYAERFS